MSGAPSAAIFGFQSGHILANATPDLMKCENSRPPSQHFVARRLHGEPAEFQGNTETLE